MSSLDDRSINAWMKAFASCVRSRDIERGRALFDPEATGFGTVAGHYSSLDDLVGSQWSNVWPRTQDFVFDEVDHRWLDASLCAVAATWRSVGTDGDVRRTRTGRATLILQRTEGAGLQAVHTHFSMTPGTPA